MRADCAVAGDEDRAEAGGAEEEEALAGEEGLGAAPLGVHLDVGGGGEEGAGLNEKGLVLDVEGDDVAGEGGGRR